MANIGEQGFTLLELLIVLAIIALVLGIIVPSVSGLINESKKKIAEANEAILKNALEMYYAANEKYPVCNNISDLEKELVSTYLNENSWDKMINKFDINYSSSDGISYTLIVKPKN